MKILQVLQGQTDLEVKRGQLSLFEEVDAS